MNESDHNLQPDADDRLNRATDALRDASVPAGPSPALIAQTLTALRQADGGTSAPPAVKATPSRNFLRKIYTMNRHYKLAAGVLLAVGLAAALIVPTMLPRQRALAFADVIGSLRRPRPSPTPPRSRPKAPPR